MSAELRISPQLALPVDVAGEAIAILAKRGAGKTNTATVLVEELHAAGVQVVILDPVGAWWGIRSSASGKGAGLRIPILGGQHGDVPLEPTAGVVAADVVVDNGASLLLDLSDFPSKSAHARFVVEFAERLFRRKAHDRTLVHLVLEEADAFAPQTKAADVARMKGAIEQIVRRGRSRGLGVTMITQRSAVLDKDVLEQTDLLIVMRTTGPNDRKAIEKWIDVHADEEEAQVVLDSLAGLKTGEAWIWNPERGLLERTQIRARKTFDSSSTPKAGERRAAPKKVAAIDLKALGVEIAATAERAKQNDPAELRKVARELESKAATLEGKVKLLERAQGREREKVVERVEVPVPVFNGQVDRLADAVGDLRSVAASIGAAAEEISKAVASAQQLTVSAARAAAPAREQGARREEAPRSGSRERVKQPPIRRPAPEPAVDGETTGAQQRVLNALAWWETVGVTAPTRLQVAMVAGYHPRTGSLLGALSELNAVGSIGFPSTGRVSLTDQGRALAETPQAPLTESELQELILEQVGSGNSGPARRRILEVLIRTYPEAIGRQELAEELGYHPRTGTFLGALAKLKSLGLVDYPRAGTVAAQPVLFLEGA